MNYFLFSFLFVFNSYLIEVRADEAVPASSPEAASDSADSGYEIDYEEEADAEGVEDGGDAEPVVKKGKKKSSAGSKTNNSAVQGSRAKNRFTPILKTENKSIYKKNGKNLDVDSD